MPTALHEQNAVLGRANRMLAPRVSRIATAFSRVSKLNPQWMNKTLRTGMPVRPAVIALRDRAYAMPEPGGPVRLLVLGGSQGARVLSEIVPAALERLPEAMRARLVVNQQCRSEDLEMASDTYIAAGIKAELATFFHDVPARLAAAHLVIVAVRRLDRGRTDGDRPALDPGALPVSRSTITRPPMPMPSPRRAAAG